ncbi:MAG: molybdopterin-dependent oxidoreductase [Coriobacteriia bacterium]
MASSKFMRPTRNLYRTIGVFRTLVSAKAKMPSLKKPKSSTEAVAETRRATCLFCDQACELGVEMDNGEITRVRPYNPKLPAMCSKPMHWREFVEHKDRVVRPLKNIGTRGEPEWREIDWDQALDEIAEKLGAVKERFGAEAVAVAHMPVNTQSGSGLVRRFMNSFGTPNYISPLALCVGNTAQVHRATYGWYTSANYAKTDCVVLFGQNRSGENWPREYLEIQAAKMRGAKLIVIDPRKSNTAEMADYHLAIRYGTDAALLLGWLNVIIGEQLYDEGFVDAMTVGFDSLAERVKEYPPEKVAEICGIGADLVRETARIYAGATAAVIPWGVTTDMQKNSTSALRCQAILRAICGYINVSETVPCPGTIALSVSEFEMHERLSDEQKGKQLGNEAYPLFSYRAMGLYKEASERVFGYPYYNLCDCSCIAHPPALFEAMRTGNPYPVKATLVLGTNTLMNWANQNGILEAFMNQDLVVVFDTFITPTAQLADYVLPADMWLERNSLGTMGMEVMPAFFTSQQVLEPRGECKNIYFLIKGLADRLGLGEDFPWGSLEELYDWRLAPLGLTWEKAREIPMVPMKPASKGAEFATPTGKVELHSSVLEALGYDPLPHFTDPDPRDLADKFPLTIFIGLREKTSYNTCLRQIEPLRKRTPEPLLLLNPADMEAYGLSDGVWAWIETPTGRIQLLAQGDEKQPVGTARVPHGWWKPETAQGISGGLSRAMLHNDGVIIPDDSGNLDKEQGLPNMRGGLRARVYACEG